MKVIFEVKYGKNILELTLNNGKKIQTSFFPKYGENRVIFPTDEYTVLTFELKYGTNIVTADIPEDVKVLSVNSVLTDLWNDTVTIYNDVTTSDGRRFDRFVVKKCNVQSGYVEKANGTVQNIVNMTTVITKDVGRYKSPGDYENLTLDKKDSYYTVKTDDFVVFSEVPDIVDTPQDFLNLKKKYKDSGMNVTAVNAYIYGADTDNITFSGA